MAKGSAMGLWRGKKGSTVFYKLTNSNNAQKQGIRERVYEVSNPQSNGQATQRMKLLPAQRVAGVLREIVERGWQGVDYGSKSRSQFLKRALSMSSGYPYIQKDDDRVVPGKYQLSKGSINKVTMTFDSVNAVSDIFCESMNPSDSTLGEFCQSLIDNNANIQEGDQLTFVVCTTVGWDGTSALEYNSAVFNWEYASFFVDPTSAEEGVNYFGSSSNLMSRCELDFTTPASGLASLQIMPKDDEVDQIVAAAIIISRLSDSGSYLRSSSTLLIEETALGNFFSTSARTRARESYQTANASVANTNWPVDGEAEEIEGTYQSTLTLAGLTGDLATANGQEILVRKRESDDTLVAVYYRIGSISEAASVVKPDGSFISVGADVETRHELLVSECPQVSDLQKILYQ